MGQHQFPKCERQFANIDSLRRHLTSSICSEDMESETMLENENSTMSEESNAGTSRSHQKEDIYGKYTDKDYGIRDNSDTDYTDEDDEDQHYSRKKASLIIGKFLLVEPIDTYKVSKVAKIRNRYNQVPHLTQDTNGKVTNSLKTPQTRAKRSALSQQVTTKHI